MHSLVHRCRLSLRAGFIAMLAGLRSFPTMLGHRRDERTEELVHSVRRSKHRGDVWVEDDRDRSRLETSGEAIRSSLLVVKSVLAPHLVPIGITPATSSPGSHNRYAPSALPSGR